MIWVKLCGMTNLEDALAAVDAGADAVGFIFVPSPRRISPELAKQIASQLPKTMDKVGVFADEDVKTLQDISAEVGLTVAQLHGHETPDYAMSLYREGSQKSRAQMRVFKSLNVGPGFESELRTFVNSKSVDGVLLDSAVFHDPQTGIEVRGGTGHKFDWKRAADFLPGIAGATRIIVAGGLSPENVGEAVHILRPWGVDVCSGVEARVGTKDHEKVKAFVAAARAS